MEIDIKDTIIGRQSQEAMKQQEELRMVNAILRVPRMCSQFHATMRRKLKVEE